MLAALFKTSLVHTEVTQDPKAPCEFLSGWLYGVSLQEVDIRFAMDKCFVVNDDLTKDIYDGMAAYEKGDMDTGN